MNFLNIKIDDSFNSGERSNIRRIDTNNPEELDRLRIIENDPATVEYVENLQTTDEGLIAFAKGSESKFCVGIVGKEGFVKPNEVNKLQGWVCFYPDEVERFQRLRDKKTLSNSFVESEIYEIIFAKYPGAEPGQMSSGLRQIIKTLRRECTKQKEIIVLTAYTDKMNVNSERLLLAAGFRKSGEIAYHPGDTKLDEIWILRLQ